MFNIFTVHPKKTTIEFYFFYFFMLILQLCFIKNKKMKTIFKLLILLCSISTFSQTTISGKVIDEKKQPVPTANIFIEGTYDGTSSDEKGNFTFTTTAIGIQTISASFLSFETTKKIIDVL